MMPQLVGIAGKAGVGKDTVGAYLVEHYGYVRYGFADPIKDLLNSFFDWKPEQWNDRDWKESPAIIVRPSRPQPPTERLTDFDMERVKKSPRQLAQWLGTEVGRNTFGEYCWIQKMEEEFRRVRRELTRNLCLPGVMVITDVRFNNEADKIRDLGGKIVYIMRKETAEVAAHSSENSLSLNHIDHVIWNNGTIPELQAAVVEALSR